MAYSQKGYTVIIDGKEVFVKDDGVQSNIKPTVAAPNISGVQSGVHIVKAKESLYSIARLYNLTVDQLCKMNNLNKNSKLKISQSLKIVSFSKFNTGFTNASFHIVKKEDTLYNISKRYNLSVSELKVLNNLTSNIISINQRLRIN